MRIGIVVGCIVWPTLHALLILFIIPCRNSFFNLSQLRRLTFPSRFEKGERVDMDADSDPAVNLDGSVVPLKDMNGDSPNADETEDIEGQQKLEETVAARNGKGKYWLPSTGYKILVMCSTDWATKISSSDWILTNTSLLVPDLMLIAE